MLTTLRTRHRPCPVKSLGRSVGLALLLLTGCNREGSAVLGIAPKTEPRQIASAKTLTGGASVAVRGKMIQKCPVAGCWFVVRDQTGTIKVDTKAAGFVVLDVPLQTEVVVSGTIRTRDSDPVIDAIGLRY